MKWLLYAALLVPASMSWAEAPDEKAALRAHIEKLEQRLAALEEKSKQQEAKQVAAEAKPAPAKQSQPASKPIVDIHFFQPKIAEGEWTEQANWAKVNKGMSKQDVETLLGEPTRKINSFMKSTARVWIYKGLNLATKSTVEGKVRFNKKGEVIGFTTPDLNS